MAIYAEPLASKEIPLGVWIYSGVPNHVPAYKYRLDYDAFCSAIWNPHDRSAKIVGLHGKITKKDLVDMAEYLFFSYGITCVQWERSSGKHVFKIRIGPRNWRTDRRC